MKPDPVREHLDTRSEREIAWQIRFLANTRQRLLRRPPNSINPPLTAEQVDRACLKAEREFATYRLAQMVIEGVSRGKRREREMRVAKDGGHRVERHPRAAGASGTTRALGLYGDDMTKPKADPDRRFAPKITAEQAAQVRLDHADGKTITEIARALGVGRSSVRMIVEGRSHRPKTAEPAP